MITVVRKSEAIVRHVSSNKIISNFITKEISDQVSFATIDANDYSEREITSYNRIYYVLDGKLILIYEGEEIILSTGDSCFLEKDTEYELKGTFKAVVINQPAFGL